MNEFLKNIIENGTLTNNDGSKIKLQWNIDKKEGEFERYKDTDVKLRGIIHCGGCPGTSPVLRMVGLKTWMAPMGETIDAIHIGTCLLDNCPYKDTIIEKVKAKAGVEVIEGTHPYRPVQVFGA